MCRSAAQFLAALYLSLGEDGDETGDELVDRVLTRAGSGAQRCAFQRTRRGVGHRHRGGDKLRGEHTGQHQSVALQGQAGQARYLLRLVPVGAGDTEQLGFVSALTEVAQAVTAAAFFLDHDHDRGAGGEQDRGTDEGAAIEQIRSCQGRVPPVPPVRQSRCG